MSQTEVKPIPDGMHTVTPHLVCAGAAEALEFYKKAFNAVEVGRMAGPQGKLLHGPSGSAIQGHAGRRIPRLGFIRTEVTKRFTGHHTPLCRRRRFVRDARRGCGSEGNDAGPGHVLGRSLRQARRPVWPPLVGLHTRSRCQPGRNATGGAESVQLTAARQFQNGKVQGGLPIHGFDVRGNARTKFCGRMSIRAFPFD